MAIPIESNVREIMTPERETKIGRSYARAMGDWMESRDRPKLNRWPRTRANNLFEYLVNHLIDEFNEDAGVQFNWHTETFKLIIDGKLLIRFKKANRNGVGSSIGTQAELDFCDPQIELPGMPGLQKIEIDYTLNTFGTAIDEINVVARNGGKPLWTYVINENGGVSGASVIPLSPPQSPVPSVEDMVRPRQPKKDEKSKKGGSKDNSRKGR